MNFKKKKGSFFFSTSLHSTKLVIASLQPDNIKILRYTSTFEEIVTFFGDIFSTICDFFSPNSTTTAEADKSTKGINSNFFYTSKLRHPQTFAKAPYTLNYTSADKWINNPVEKNNNFFREYKKLMADFEKEYNENLAQRRAIRWELYNMPHKRTKAESKTLKEVSDYIITNSTDCFNTNKILRTTSYPIYLHNSQNNILMRHMSLLQNTFEIMKTSNIYVSHNSNNILGQPVVFGKFDPRFYDFNNLIHWPSFVEKLQIKEIDTNLRLSFKMQDDIVRKILAFYKASVDFPNQKNSLLYFEGPTNDWLNYLNLSNKEDFDLYTSQLMFINYLRELDPTLWAFFADVLIPIMVNKDHQLTLNSLDILFGIRCHKIEDYDEIHNILKSIAKSFLMNNYFYINETLIESKSFSENDFFHVYKRNSRSYNLLLLLNKSVLATPQTSIKWDFEL